MSFQRDLTGSSNLYANVILNTNISASSVSTINLSATNASFTNITTNTWTTGNVSTPNVIATNGYFSNLYISSESISSFNICSLNACNIYASNSSITNLSTLFINASTITAFITNQSTANVCLISTSTIYATNAYISNISVNASLDVDGDVIAVTGRFEHLQIQNAGGNTQFEIEQVTNYTNLNIVNSGVQSMEFTRLNSSLMSLNTSQCIFWNPIYTSNAYVSSASITNLSTSNISNSSLISTSTLTAYIINVSTENSCLINTSTIYSTYGYVSNFSMSNASIGTLSVSNFGLTSLNVSSLNASNIYVDYNGCVYIDGTLDTNYCINQFNQIKNSGGNVVFESYNKNISQAIVMNISNTGTNFIDFKRLDNDLMRLSTSQIFFYNPTYCSTGYCSINNNSTTNTITANICTLNVSTYTSISSSYRANFSSVSASNISCTALTASGDIEAKSALITNNGVIFKEFNSSSLIPIFANIYQTSTSSASTWLFEGFGVNNILFNVYGTDTLNISENYLSAVNSELNISNISTKQILSTNISVPGRISVSNISATSISATGRINADNIITANNITSNGGTLQAPFGSFATLSASALSVSQGVFCNFVSCNQVSSTSMATSWLNGSNASVTNASITTLTGTTINGTTINASNFNASTFSLTNLSLTNLSVTSNATIASLSTTTTSTGTIYIRDNVTATARVATIHESNNRLAIETLQANVSGIYLGVGSANPIIEVTSTSIIFYESLYTSNANPIYVSVGNFSTLNTCTFAPANINTSTMTCSTVNAITGNFSTLNASTFSPANITTTTLNASTGNFSTLNASTWNLPLTISTSTINGSTGNFSILNASTWNLPTTITTSTINCSTGNFSNITSNTISASSISVSNLSIISSLTVSTATVSRINVCNACILNLSIADTITAGDANISYIFAETIYPNYIVCTTGGEFADTIYVSKLDVEEINNSFSTINKTQPLTLYSVSNTIGTGLRVPTYIDSQDLGALTIGYNQTAGFINVCRATRFYGNVLTDNNFNTITATTDLGLGTNLTSGVLKIGSTTMTGNISIDTTGDVVFGCDIRSTWNTSDLIKNSTQIGSFYRQTATVANTKTNTGQTFIFSPNNANTSLSTSPIGLYLVSATAIMRTQAAYSATVTAMNLGTCYGGTYNFTNATTTRQSFAAISTQNTSGTTNYTQTLSFCSVLNMSTTGNYIGVFSSLTADAAAAVGSVYFEITSATVTKIA